MPTRISSSVVTSKIQKLLPKAVEPRVSWRSASRPSGRNERTRDRDSRAPSGNPQEAAEREVEPAREENWFLHERGQVPRLAAPEQVQRGEHHPEPVEGDQRRE